MWLPESPMGANPEMQAFGSQPGNFSAGAEVPQESVWSRMASSIKNDPALQLGLLTIGLNMMQPIQPGQTSMGHLAQAVGQGVNTIGSTRDAEFKRKMTERQVGQGDRRLDITETGQKEQVRQGDERIATDRDRVGLEKRRVQTGERVADSQIASEEQKRTQNEQMFPRLLAKADTEIDRLVAAGKLDGAQADLIREKARLYPKEVDADLRRARASEVSAQASATSAGKKSAQENIFETTAQAMVKSGEAKTIEEAYSSLGQEMLGKSRSGSTSATVQAADSYVEAWTKANPKGADETPEAYEQRKGAAKLRFMESKKQDDYLTGWLKAGENALDPDEAVELRRQYDEQWRKTKGEIPSVSPTGAAPSGQPKVRDVVSKADVAATAKKYGISEKEVIDRLKQKNPNLKVQ